MFEPTDLTPTPWVPKCCELTPRGRVIMIAVCRAIFSFLSLGFGAALITAIIVINKRSAEHPHDDDLDFGGAPVVLVLICLINLVQFIVAVALIVVVAKTTSNLGNVKGWLMIEMILTAIYIMLIIILVCILPGSRLYLLLGVKFTAVSIYYAYRSAEAFELYKANEDSALI